MGRRLDERFTRWVRESDDQRLAHLMGSRGRRLVLREIFRSAARRVDPEVAGGERALIEIRIREEDGAGDRWQLLVARGRCTASRRDLGEPDTTVVFDPVDFLRFIAGQERTRDLFLSRRVSVDGSLLLAAELPSLFRLPGPEATPEGLAD